MLPFPQVAEPLLISLSIAFTQPTFNRILVLLAGAILAKGRRTITSILWGMLAIVVKFPFTNRPWALPVLCALYRPRELNELEGRRHKTPIMLVQGLMCVLMRWFPEKKFIFLGDGGYASHEFAGFCHRHRKQATLGSRFHGDAAIYDPPPKYRGHRRPRVKGRTSASKHPANAWLTRSCALLLACWPCSAS